jgi:hypothetical protein
LRCVLIIGVKADSHSSSHAHDSNIYGAKRSNNSKNSSSSNSRASTGDVSRSAKRGSHATDVHHEYDAGVYDDGDADDASENSVCTTDSKQQHINYSVKQNSGTGGSSSSSAASRAARRTTQAAAQRTSSSNSKNADSSNSDEAADEESNSSSEEDDSDADSTGVQRRSTNKKAGIHALSICAYSYSLCRSV